MAARIFLFTHVLDVDAAKRTVVSRVVRWPGLAFAPAMASIPAALLWVESRGVYELTRTGWALTIIYGLTAIALAAIFLAPHRRVAIDFATGRLAIAGPYGIGRGLDAAPASLETSYEESEWRVPAIVGGPSAALPPGPDRTVPVARLRVITGARRRTIVHYTNDAVPIARELARSLTATRAGERADLDALERTVIAAARKDELPQLALLLTAMVICGAALATIYGRG